MTSTGDEDLDILFALVGRVASSYANLDATVRGVLADLFDDSARGRAIADDLSTEQVIGAVRRAIRADPGEGPMFKYAHWVLGAANQAGKERADVAHSSWYLVEHPGDEPWEARAVPTKKRDGDHRRFDVQDLLRLETGIDATAVLTSTLSWLANYPERLTEHLTLPAATVPATRMVAAGLVKRDFHLRPR